MGFIGWGKPWRRCNSSSWEFHHGGSVKPGVVIATWEGYKKAGPLVISTDHKGTADGKPFTLSLTNVAVRLAGSDTWIEAK